MLWNWQQPDWPHFTYDKISLEPLEQRFLHESGILLGAFKHIGEDDKKGLIVDIISNEALKTSEIEGEFLNRDSLQSSIRRQFGIDTDSRKIPPAEQGIAKMMVDLYHSYSKPLTHKTLFHWHTMLAEGHRNMHDIGRYRTHPEPMQVISGGVHAPQVHFEAPPSDKMKGEMEKFIEWFNDSAPSRQKPLPALTRTGIAHLYFVSIHPFEDGNGRIGRAISEHALAQSFEQPTLLALAYVIERNKKAYYNALERANKSNTITGWLEYFAGIVLEAHVTTQKRVDFLIAKARLYDRVKGKLNPRQEKILERIFREGIDGFKGGLSAENYISITKTSRATATRDLQDLVAKGALTKSGELKHTRYRINIGS